jgi:GNAT superfamily N-acetyltransferase
VNDAAIIRSLSPDDDLATLTTLIHAAYAARKADNLQYWGTRQSVEDTAERFGSGHGLIAVLDGEMVGTLTVRPSTADRDVQFYRTPGIWSICQFAVLPDRQNQGIGRRLHDAAMAHAAKHGGHTLALDTALPAIDLIEMYRHWGYRIIGEHDHRPFTNYLSVVMAQPIRPIG